MTPTSLKMAFLVALLFSVYGLKISYVLAQEKASGTSQYQSKNDDDDPKIPCKVDVDCENIGCPAQCIKNYCECTL
ncbi:hypothetical protein Hanom_Chr00s116804g01810021 [Helianthus anomalus]